MENGLLRKSAISALMCLALGFSGMLPEDRCYAQNTKKVDGLNFQVPEDWPIEKRGGVLGPIPTEEYVSMKFKDIDEEFKSLRSELMDQIKELQSNVDKMGSQLPEKTDAAEAQGAVQGAPAADLAGILARLDEMENQLGRLDRKLTGKLMDVQKMFEENNLRAQKLEETFEELQAQFFKLDEEVGYIAEKQKSAY